jgi:hypothetical protein
MRLRVCGGCGRHVRWHEPRCPFCGARVAALPENARYGLAAAVALGIGVAVSACGDNAAVTESGPVPISPDGASGSGGVGGGVVFYGPCPRCGAAAMGGMDGGTDSAGGPTVLYAAVPIDAGDEQR